MSDFAGHSLFIEEAIQALEGVLRDSDYYSGWVSEAIDMAIEALRMVKGQKWVPLSEAMPGELEDVWITSIAGVVHSAYLDEEKGWRITDVERGVGFDDRYVVAWMPMQRPEPYKTKVGSE